MSPPPSRPVMRYFGGKWQLAPWICAHLPPHRVYVEPFAGAASVLMRKERAYSEILNDVDGEIVNLFRVLQDSEQAVHLRRLVELTPFSRQEFELAYEPTPEPVERARRTLIRSFMGVSGVGSVGRRTGFRVDTTRRGTSPAHDWARWPREITAIAERLRGVVIEHRDAFEVIRRHDAGDTLFYVDPPYLAESRASAREYRHEFSTLEEHEALSELLRESTAMVAVSAYPSALYDDWYGRAGWTKWQRRAYSGSVQGSKARIEVLWLNPLAAAAAEAALVQGGIFAKATA